MMVNSTRSKIVGAQHNSACHDCPMRREALPGWLGGATPEEYRGLAHSDAVVDCHAYRFKGNARPQCAGIAIYRANVVKRCDPPNMKLLADREAVFATPMEFLAHHGMSDEDRRAWYQGRPKTAK